MRSGAGSRKRTAAGQSLVAIERSAAVQPCGDNIMPSMPTQTVPSLPSMGMEAKGTDRVPPEMQKSLEAMPVQRQIDRPADNPILAPRRCRGDKEMPRCRRSTPVRRCRLLHRHRQA